jgi:hypothetical protein
MTASATGCENPRPEISDVRDARLAGARKRTLANDLAPVGGAALGQRVG